MFGFVVSVQRADGGSEFYNVVCEGEAEAMRLVKDAQGFTDEPMQILRPLAAWEIACFNLDPLAVKRAA